jgi:hypothetical protein
VRTASLRALASLDHGAHLPRLVAMLDDAAPGVSRAARRALRPHVGQVGPEALLRVLRTASHMHGRLGAVLLGAALGKWDSLPILLEAAADGDGRIRTSARSLLRSWVARQNRSFAQPTPVQLRAIGAALDTYHLAVDASLARELRAILHDWAA